MDFDTFGEKARQVKHLVSDLKGRRLGKQSKVLAASMAFGVMIGRSSARLDEC